MPNSPKIPGLPLELSNPKVTYINDGATVVTGLRFDGTLKANHSFVILNEGQRQIDFEVNLRAYSSQAATSTVRYQYGDIVNGVYAKAVFELRVDKDVITSLIAAGVKSGSVIMQSSNFTDHNGDSTYYSWNQAPGGTSKVDAFFTELDF